MQISRAFPTQVLCTIVQLYTLRNVKMNDITTVLCCVQGHSNPFSFMVESVRDNAANLVKAQVPELVEFMSQFNLSLDSTMEEFILIEKTMLEVYGPTYNLLIDESMKDVNINL